MFIKKERKRTKKNEKERKKNEKRTKKELLYNIYLKNNFFVYINEKIYM